ncbi:MAG: hypothetical protein NTY69_03880 [Methylococcales bacterium]|nr:hypothetical protein [Methylococcales bacterium]
MKKYLSFIMLLLVSTNVLSDEYKCKVKEIQQLNSDGKLSENEYTKTFQKYNVTLMWGDSTRVLRHLDEKGDDFCCTRLYDVIQSGGYENGLKASHIQKGLASIFVSYFSIYTFEKELPFLLNDGGDILTGNCIRL